jgi:metal-sulfur cluster biosynthetic enzyme
MSRIPDAADVWGALATIPDPEFGVNVVDLGLIYSVRCDAGNIDVVMTLTTPGCPAGSWIHDGAKQAVASLPGASKVNIRLVFEPPWVPAMLSDAARRQLGRPAA